MTASRSRGQPLSIRLALFLSAAVLAVLLLTGVAVNRLVSRSLADELSNAQQRQVEFLADQLAGVNYPFTFDTTDFRVRQFVGRLARSVRGRVSLLDGDGDAVHVAGNMPPGTDRTRIEQPIEGDAGLTLVLEVSSTDQPFLRVFNTTLLIAGVLAVVALMLVAVLLSERITRPLRRISIAAGRLGAGDLSARAEGGADRESAELAGAFNAMADRLERSEQLRRRAASDMAHDLATPATVLESQLQAMVDGVVPADREQLERARSAAGAMSGVIVQLRELVDVEAAAVQRRPAPVAAGDLLAEAAQALEPYFRERGVALVREPGAEMEVVEVDASQVGRALRNVLANAAQHSPPGGEVRLSAYASDGVTIRVADGGHGIDPADLPHVFERFYRADRSRGTAQPQSGSGIGLTIARELLAANGGSIEVERTGPDGTTFALTLPRQSAAL